MRLIKAEIMRYGTELKVYYPDQIVDIVTKYILFVAFFHAFTVEPHNTGYYIGYIYWIVASSIISELSVGMSSEKQIGTIEHLMIMPNSLLCTLVVRTYTILLFTMIKSSIIILLIGLTLPITFDINVVIVIIFLISLIGFTGVGLLLSGLTMKFAKVASFETLISYSLLLISGSVIPFYTFSPFFRLVFEYVPFTSAIYISQNSLLGSYPSAIQVLSLIVLNVIFLAVGYFIFKLFLLNAKSKGIANNY
jgi:ABC-2 type transport system permease protein